MIQKIAEKFGKFFKSFSTMAKRVLLLWLHLGEGSVMACGYEHGIIPEPLFSLGLTPDPTFSIAEEGTEFPVRKGQRDAADKTGVSLFLRR